MLPAMPVRDRTLIPHCCHHANRGREQQRHMADARVRGPTAVPVAGGLVGTLVAVACGQSSLHAVNVYPHLNTLVAAQPGVFSQHTF